MDFWFGRIYKNISTDDIKALYHKATLYEINKNDYIRKTIKDRAVMKRMYKDFQYILPYEIMFDKDLRYFTQRELEIVLVNISKTTSYTVSKRISNLVNTYNSLNADYDTEVQFDLVTV